MSHPVFLNATSTPRMPDGSSGEWEAFFADGGPELESNARIPLLWIALFTSRDLHWARLIDDEDLDSDAREDLIDFGDTQYPYLLTSLERALAMLAQRAPMLVAQIGAAYAPIIDNFAQHLRLHYGPYVLLRTSGLPDVADYGPTLQKALDDFELLDQGGQTGPDNAMVADIADTRRWLTPEKLWVLTGSGHDFTQREAEPETVVVPVEEDVAVKVPADVAVKAPADMAVEVPADVAAPARVVRRPVGTSSTASGQQPAGRHGTLPGPTSGSMSSADSALSGAPSDDSSSARTEASSPAHKPDNKWVGWAVALAVGLPTVGVFKATGSVWISGILFVLLCAAAGWFMKRRA